MHQLSPYIGKLKSSIARALILEYSKEGQLIVDPFFGSGTVPLEATLLSRKVFAGDISGYARVLCRAKLNPPSSIEAARTHAERLLDEAARLPVPDLRRVPLWVRKFFHPKTLKEAISFATICREKKEDFFFACLLGILHHQRPGFLSYPSSHLVPYLRTKKFPRNKFSHLYNYRELRSRLLAKIGRAFKRTQAGPATGTFELRQSSIEHLTLPKTFDCLITSPPYMNALDYVRDNRLRLWFVNPVKSPALDDAATTSKEAFENGMVKLARQVNSNLSVGGHCIFVVGEEVTRKNAVHPSKAICDIIAKHAPRLKLDTVLTDDIPDIRRSRRDCRGTKTEHFLIFRG